MAQFLPFWPKAVVGGNLADQTAGDCFSRALPTNGFTEVVIEMQIDLAFASAGGANSYVKVWPQISNDGVNWEDQTSTLLMTQAMTYPQMLVEKYTDIGAFMRMRIELEQNTGAAAWIGATLYVAGAGRS